MNGRVYAGDETPRNYSGHRLYIVEFSTGTIKVGRSINAASRIRNHDKSARPFDIRVVRSWISEELPEQLTADLEAALLDAVSRIAARRVGAEYFTGVSFERCVSVASRTASDDAGVQDLPLNMEHEALATWLHANFRRGLVVAWDALSYTAKSRWLNLAAQASTDTGYSPTAQHTTQVAS